MGLNCAGHKFEFDKAINALEKLLYYNWLESLSSGF